MSDQLNQPPPSRKPQTTSRGKRVVAKKELPSHQEANPQVGSEFIAAAKEKVALPTLEEKSSEDSYLSVADEVQVLIALLEHDRQWRQHTIAFVEKRIDTLLTLAYAIAAGLALLSSHMARQDFLFLTLLSSLGLLGVGLATFRLVLERDITAVDFTREINGIRGLLSAIVPKLLKVLKFPISQELPKYNALSNHPQIVMVINGFSIGASVVVISLLISSFTLGFSSLVFGGISFIGAYIIQFWFANRWYNRAETK